MIDSVDQSVGRVLAKLEELRLAKNTIVIFTSDNGGHGRLTSHYPLRGCKGNFYEGGIRIPLIVRWPGKVAPRSTCETPVITHDFYPSLLEAVGLPPMPEQHVDGVSMMPLWTQTDDLKERALYWHFPNYIGATHVEPARPLSVIRDGNWKLLCEFDGSNPELYDLDRDPSERNNLAAVQPGVVRRLTAQVLAWHRSMPSDHGATYKPAAQLEETGRNRTVGPKP